MLSKSTWGPSLVLKEAANILKRQKGLGHVEHQDVARYFVSFSQLKLPG